MEFVLMTEGERASCASLAAEAFADYEYFGIYIPEDEKRRRFLNRLLACEFKANKGLPKVHFLVAKEQGKVVAVAQLCEPGFRKPSDLRYLLSGWLKAVRIGGSQEVNAWNAMEKQASAPCHALTGDVWYLSLLTVAKSAEGRGIGSRFLQEGILPFVKAHGGGKLSLFTNSRANQRFYEKNGFTLFDEKRFDYGGKSIGSWSYIRSVR